MSIIKYPSIKDRYQTTLDFVRANIHDKSTILDIGTRNELSEFMSANGFNVKNTEGEDLDVDYDLKKRYGQFDVVTAFEILEHLVSPFALLKELPTDRLVATVPLRLWFAPAFKNINDEWDRHFHEFEDWQFD
ncbi:MAG: hypothetical protein K8R35_06745 [Bacteroidales bacterium]|nr:hypothetical protein [Bacteroidales bacterium]